MTNKTLMEVLPTEFRGYSDSEAYKYKDVKVVVVHDGTVNPWPGHEKNVFWWYTLENGKRVGWNENPSRGWTFPVLGKPRIKEKMRRIFRVHVKGKLEHGLYRDHAYADCDSFSGFSRIANRLQSWVISHKTPYSIKSDYFWQAEMKPNDKNLQRLAREIDAAYTKYIKSDSHSGIGRFGWNTLEKVIGYFNEEISELDTQKMWEEAFEALEVSIIDVPESQSYMLPDGQVMFDLEYGKVVKTFNNYADMVSYDA